MKRYAWLAALGWFVSFSTHAQISWQPNFNLAPAILQAQVLNPCPQGRCSDAGHTPNAPGGPVANAALLRFTPSLAVRKRNLAGFVAKTRAHSPDGAAQLEQFLASTDVFASFAQALAPKGLRIDDVADAYAVYWISAWEAAHGIVGKDTPREQAQAVKAQASRALLSTPSLAGATSAQRQELAEALLIQAALISASAEAGANTTQLRTVGHAVRQGAKAMGLDLDTMRLGEAGFEAAR
jgi:hypothetical protein